MIKCRPQNLVNVMNSFLYYISILNAHLPFHRKWWGFMFWSLQHHLSTFIPFHPTVWTYWNYFRFLDANAPSLCFSPGLCKNLPIERTGHTHTHTSTGHHRDTDVSCGIGAHGRRTQTRLERSRKGFWNRNH